MARTIPPPPILVGTENDDTLIAGKKAETIYGLGGNDKITAGAGDDTIYAGFGNDTVFAGKGNDNLYGEWGNDTLYGEDGNDNFYHDINQNLGAVDVYDGGANSKKGGDTLYLYGTLNQLSELSTALSIFNSPGFDKTQDFHFINYVPWMDLTIRNIESIQFVVVNTAPIANADAYSVNEDGSLNVTPLGVLANDSDPDGNVLSTKLVSDVAHGTLSLNSNGSFVYTPDADYNGTDSFSYVAFDGVADSNVATVTITVTPENDAPLATNDDYTVSEDSTLTIPAPGILANDSDIDGDPLTANLISDVSNGTLTLNADGSFTYIPNGNYNGFDSFTYAAYDGSSETTATVNITIDAMNDAPTAENQSFVKLEGENIENAPLAILDIDGDLLTTQLVDGKGPSSGFVSLGGYTFTYVPNDINFDGVDSFSYLVSDGEYSTEATITINYTPVNDAPIAVDDGSINNAFFALVAGTSLIIDPAILLLNDIDVDGDPLNAKIIAGPTSNGQLYDNGDGTYTYVPNSGYEGLDSFTYVANDGTIDSDDPATVYLNIIGSNEAPVAVSDSYTIDEDVNLDVPGPSGPGVLANDSDGDLDPLTAELVFGKGPTLGVVSLFTDGSFHYDPASNVSGVDTFTYRVFDGTTYSNEATVTITINAVNDAPTASFATFSVDEDQEGGITITAADLLAKGFAFDADLDPLKIIPQSQPTSGTLVANADGSLTYTPVLNFNGDAFFNYIVDDNTGSSNSSSNLATMVINVVSINDAPTAPAETTFNIKEDGILNAAVLPISDVDNPVTFATIVSGPSNGEILFLGGKTFSYAPDPNFSGTDSFKYYGSDGMLDTGPDLLTAYIVVAPVNDRPVAAPDFYATFEDVSLLNLSLTANDTDVDNLQLFANIVTYPLHGDLIANADGTFNYIPDDDYFNLDSFTYRADDRQSENNESLSTATVTIFITAVNDPPVAGDDSYVLDEDTTLIVDADSGLLANDTDVDSTFLTLSLLSSPTNGTLLSFNTSTGAFTYEPNLNYRGPDSFTYRVSDGSSFSDATVKLTINDTNEAPVAVDDPDVENIAVYSVDEDNVLNVYSFQGVLLNDTDAEGDPLTAILVSGPSNAFGFFFYDDGSFSYVPQPNSNGTDTFTYKVNDGSLDSNIATVTVTINSVNDAPVLSGTPTFTVDVNTIYTANTASGLLVYATDVDSSTLTPEVVSGPANGSLTINPDGSFEYDPNPNYIGSDSFTYKVNDGELVNSDSNTLKVDINVQLTLNPTTFVDQYNFVGFNFTTHTLQQAYQAAIADGALSLREAITLANYYDVIPGSTDYIILDVGTYTLLPGAGDSGGDLDVTQDLIIYGATGIPGDSVIDGLGTLGDRIIEVTTGDTLELYDLTIRGGNTGDVGGGILADGELIAYNIVVDDNTATFDGGGIYAVGGGSITNSTIGLLDDSLGDIGNFSSAGTAGIYASNGMVITNTTISWNVSSSDIGGFELLNSSISNSTIANNDGADTGGGDLNASTMDNSTVANNTADDPIGIDGIRINTSSTVSNSIIVGNTDDPSGVDDYDVFDNTSSLYVDSNNLVTIVYSPSNSFGDYEVTTYEAVFGSNVLADNGGPTQTIALDGDNPTNPAIDTGSAEQFGVDQRGVEYVDIDGVGDVGIVDDIGAYEYSPIPIGEVFSFSSELNLMLEDSGSSEPPSGSGPVVTETEPVTAPPQPTVIVIDDQPLVS